MSEDRTRSDDEERGVNFALLIRQTTRSDAVSLHIASENEEIPDAEVILVIEAWLDKARQAHRDRISDGMNFSFWMINWQCDLLARERCCDPGLPSPLVQIFRSVPSCRLLIFDFDALK